MLGAKGRSAIADLLIGPVATAVTLPVILDGMSER